MASSRWPVGLVVMIPLAVLGIIVVIDALLPSAIVVAGAFGMAAIVASVLVSAGSRRWSPAQRSCWPVWRVCRTRTWAPWSGGFVSLSPSS